MGQYHTIYNVTKKECFYIGMSKLLEKSFDPLCSTALMLLVCNSNGRGGGDLYVRATKFNEKTFTPIYSKKDQALQKAIDKVSGRWAGDQIVIQGDYAEPTDPAFITDDQLKSFKDITKLLLSALKADSELKQMIESEV